MGKHRFRKFWVKLLKLSQMTNFAELNFFGDGKN